MQGAFPRPDAVNPVPPAAKASGTAVAAVVAGVLSFLCIYGVGGILAITLGWLAHSEIERAEGRLTGKRLASVAVGLGILNVIASIVAVGVLVAYAVRPDPPSSAPPRAPPVAVRPAPPALAAPTQPPAAAPGAGATPRETTGLPSLPGVIGKLAVVDVSGQALEPLLLAQLKQGAKLGENVVLWTVAPDCDPCAAVGKALVDARMQRALAGIRLVRADIASSRVELAQLGVPLDAIPGFTLLDARARPLDHIHGGEWGDDVPANIAPILDKFVRRTLSSRRFPWVRPLRDGETPL